MNYTRSDFGQGFHWGVSAAAYQTEGAYDSEGKGPSIWDHFTSRKGKIFNNENARVTCDFYNRYREDLALMSGMQIPNFRFSIAWSRIFPDGTGTINKAGVDFYHRVIDGCLSSGIKPWITLYHWDLPLALEEKGGWTNREVIHWFSEYVFFCVSTFGDRVGRWIILNEPMVFTGAGYFLGLHAPGRKGLSHFLAAMHHAALCQAEGARVARAARSQIKIGTTFSCSMVEPFTATRSDQAAARRVDVLLNRVFVEPLLGLGYPVKDLRIIQRMEPYVKDGDERKLACDMDFIGVQNYTREIVYHSWLVPFLQAKILKASRRRVEKTLMNWEVYPPSIYHMLKQFSAYQNIPELIVTENGAAFNDHVEDGKVMDLPRQQFLENYLGQVLRAKREGVNVNGYFVWSFTDNFEWAEGYIPRFGLVYIDFSTQQRIVKYSGLWYSRFLAEAGAEDILLAG